MSTPRTFSLTDPLPHGVVAVQASAGTGKTFALAGLVLRYVAEAGVPIDQILVVTFTRAAAAELRVRVRSRLAEAAAALRTVAHAPDAGERTVAHARDAGHPGSVAEPVDRPPDEVLALLASTARDGTLERVERAMADIDAATITTIHSFAQQVLGTLGSAAPGDLDAALVDDTRALVASVCADLVAAAAVDDPAGVDLLPSVGDLEAAVATVLGNPGIRLVPDLDDPGATPAAALRRRLVDLAVAQVHRRRRHAGTVSFDDVLTGLAEALAASPAAVDALRRRYRVALVDEFQDTDPVQWEIFERLFAGADAGTALVLVGDPKQAIYGFRGADVHTYLRATAGPGVARRTLATNWRSDGALLDALGRLLAGATFGSDDIAFAAVGPAPGNEHRRMTTPAGDPLPALAVRVAAGAGLEQTLAGKVTTAAADRAVAADLAGHVHRLLDTARLPAGADGATRALRPADVAVLVARNAEGRDLQRALRARGIPAVIARGDSVLDSEAARHWRWLLAALDQPADPARARTAAQSCFFGWHLADVAAADDAAVGAVQEDLARWAELLAARGTVELCAHLWAETQVAARALATADGDRLLTDLEHVAGLLRSLPAGRRPTAATLLALLDDLRAGPAPDPDQDVTARRVESEAQAVQIMTIHTAKGLEFPVVCVPTMWRGSLAAPRQVLFQDDATGRRTFDVASAERWPTAAAARRRRDLATAGTVGENLRLLYVALTRARHHTALWWSPTKDGEATGLARVLFARDGAAVDPHRFGAARVALPADDETVAFLADALGAGDGIVDVSPARRRGPAGPPWRDPDAAAAPTDLRTARLDRLPDRRARRWSFTAIADQAEAVGPGGPGEPGGEDADDDSLGDARAGDEGPDVPGDGAPAAAGTPGGATSTPVPLGDVPGGAGFGELVHQVLERVDFAAADLGEELERAIAECLRWHPWPVDPVTLAAGLLAVVDTPAGAALGGRSLRGLARTDCLRELRFELPLGDRSRCATDRDLGSLVRSHLPGDHPLLPWAGRLAAGAFGVELAGHLTGSIDLVVRVTDPTGSRAPRFAVCDYKTNRLGEVGRPPSLADYHPDHLAGAMAGHDYPLQALLYAVALHRYLRWRLPGYDPAAHLGGAAYLFVRGMAGTAAVLPDGRPYGVFTWDLPPALVAEASDLLAGRAGAAVPAARRGGRR